MLAPGGIVFGLAEAIWISIGIVQYHYAKEYQKYSNLDFGNCVAYVSAILWPVIFLTEASGQTFLTDSIMIFPSNPK